jgi:outer membrane protein assembly factor BamB
MAKSSLLFIGIKGTVMALDRATGQQVWVTKLKGGDFVNVALEDGDLYATNKGEIFCLDPATGQIRWRNPLKGYGWGLVSIASAGSSQSLLIRAKQAEDEAAAAAAGGAGGATF